MQLLHQHAFAASSSPLQFEVSISGTCFSRSAITISVRICSLLISTHLLLLLHHSSLKFSSTCFYRSAINISARICNYFFTTPVWSFPSAALSSLTVPSPSQHCNAITISALQCHHHLSTVLPHIHHGATVTHSPKSVATDSPQHCFRTFITVLPSQIHHSTAVKTSPQYSCDKSTTVLLLQTQHSTTIAHSPLTTALPPHLHRGTAVKPHLNTTATNPLQYCSYKLTAVLRSHIHRRPQYCHHIFTAVLQSTSP